MNLLLFPLLWIINLLTQNGQWLQKYLKGIYEMIFWATTKKISANIFTYLILQLINLWMTSKIIVCSFLLLHTSMNTLYHQYKKAKLGKSRWMDTLAVIIIKHTTCTKNPTPKLKTLWNIKASDDYCNILVDKRILSFGVVFFAHLVCLIESLG